MLMMVVLSDGEAQDYNKHSSVVTKANELNVKIHTVGLGSSTRYFTDYRGNGRYSLKVHAEARNNTARLSLRQPQNKALYIPGYIENGKWH